MDKIEKIGEILVIDDAEVIRKLLYEYLTELGYTVHLAKDGQEGIEKALTNDYTAVFCDIHMPKKNGYEVYREVSMSKPELPFIITDSLPDQLAEMAQKDGAQYCLTKPFDLDQVKEVLQAVLPQADHHERREI
ncbi:MAG: response regulator [Candidatus Zixiibacteriota bacterium]